MMSSLTEGEPGPWPHSSPFCWVIKQGKGIHAWWMLRVSGAGAAQVASQGLRLPPSAVFALALPSRCWGGAVCSGWAELRPKPAAQRRKLKWCHAALQPRAGPGQGQGIMSLSSVS